MAMSQPVDPDRLFDIDNPFTLFQDWFKTASETEKIYPEAMTLATVDAYGVPDARIVLLRGLDANGFVFYTNSESTKGQELTQAPRAALCFYWPTLCRQVRVRGAVEKVQVAEADAYFAGRPRGSQIGAWASRQSRPLSSRAELEEEVARVEQRYDGADVPRPPHWLGYRVVPVAIEFWIERPFRLHDRRVFRRAAVDAPWVSERLYP